MPVPQSMMYSPIDPIRRSSGSGFESPVRGHVEVTLHRDGQCVQWGFRLVGGADLKKSLLTIQKVVRGSPAYDSGLAAGDVVTSINHKNTANMSHATATELIKKTGTSLYLTVNRGVQSPMSAPVSPLPNPLLAPLPTSVARGHLPPVDKRGPETMADHEQEQFCMEKHREKQAIVNQPYRTLPVISAQPKVRHDYPTGSYLEKPGSEYCNNQPIKNPISMSPMIVPIQTYGAYPNQIVGSLNPDAKLNRALNQVGADPEMSFIKNTYNSPIGLYSQQNVNEALKPRVRSQPPTGHQSLFNSQNLASATQAHQYWPPNQLPHRTASPSMPRLTSPTAGRGRSPATRVVSPQQRQASYELANHIPAPIHLQPSGIVLPNTGIDRPLSADITQSPTYQLVQAMEVGRDHGPVREVQYVVNSPTDVGTGGGMGLPEQSQSFKLLRNSLLHEGQRAA